jgi:hypothetical protein
VIGALRAAGFAGIEAEEGCIHARLPVSSAPFTARPEGGLWRLAVLRPLRASAEQIAGWNAIHPQAPMDLWQGETRVSLLAPAEPEALHRWAAVAEEAVATCLRWRRAQRAPGEGM